MKNRSLVTAVKSKIDSPFGRITVVTGARQTGKTTLTKKVAKNYHYVSFDDPLARSQYAQLSAQEWHHIYPRAILDEIQKLPQMTETIKAVHDTFEDARYILTGSSQILLMENIRESLAGRASLFELYPLTLPEMMTRSWDTPIEPSPLIQWLQEPESADLLFSGIPQASPGYAIAVDVFRNYLTFGGMPALSTARISEADKRDWLNDYIRTYLQKDVRDLGNIRELEPFTLAQQAAAQHTGCLINFSDLGRLAAINSVTAKRFMNYLEISYQIVLLRPWFRNPNKRLSKSPKLHFLDPGIQRALVQRTGELTGREFESAVIAEIIKQIKNARLNIQFYHLRTPDGREVDLLLETPEGYIPIEIKQARQTSPTDARHLRGLEPILDKPILGNLVISQDPVIRKFDEQTFALPAAWLLNGECA